MDSNDRVFLFVMLGFFLIIFAIISFDFYKEYKKESPVYFQVFENSYSFKITYKNSSFVCNKEENK